MYDIKKEFPLFQQHPSLIYLDNAATTQKPQAVIDAIVDFYTKYNANIHRGIYTFGERATELYEQARETIAHFIGADPEEIVFVKNATEGINLVAYAWGMQHIQAGDAILLTQYEHHANIVPWQRVAQQHGATLSYVPIRDDGCIDYSQLNHMMSSRTKLVSCSAVSNVTGIYADIQRIVHAAHAVGARVLVDAAQLVAHEAIDVKAMGADFLVFSGHKLYGPTGIGVLYIKKELQKQMVPYQLGGGMIFSVDWADTQYLEGTHMFEAGTPPIAQAIGLAAACTWLAKHNMHAIQQHESLLMHRLLEGLLSIPRLHIIGSVQELSKKGQIVSFVIEGIHAHDVAAFLNEANIAVRAGHHCAQLLAKRLHIDASVRVSIACYTTQYDIDMLIGKLSELVYSNML